VGNGSDFVAHFFMNTYLKICFNKFLGRCPKCEIDYNLEHHPNNLDCAGFKPFKILMMGVKEKDENKSKEQ
jgi:hypothetical protein